MKLVRFGYPGKERAGIVARDGSIRDVSKTIPDWTPENLSPNRLSSLGSLDLARMPVIPESTRLGVPVAGTRKFLAIGLNYRDHALEANLPIPSEPVLFTKAVSCLSGPNDEIMLPRGSNKTDWEVEIAVVIGTRARYISPSEASSRIAGYCLANDVSEREYQTERGGTWDKGKGCDTFGPIGPWLVTPDELGDVQNVDLWLDVNGTRRQTGNTATMIFTVAHVVSYVSQFITLEPGDILTTGTPPGVGLGMKPIPIYLREGDVIRLGSPKLGEQTQRVVAWRPTTT
jgi:2,4-diketo-3-deoxy-L-fuconate hydrolase